MLKRTLYFTQPYHLGISNKQLMATAKKDKKEKTIPLEDVGYIILEDPQITCTQTMLQLCAENNVAVIICNSSHLPASMLLTLDGNLYQGGLFSDQISGSESLKKNLWKQTIEMKIKNQGALLKQLGKSDEGFSEIAGSVKSGDSTNREAFAAKLYWQRLFNNDELDNPDIKFTRHRGGPPPNNALNYGYAILRAATAKALISSGLLPTLGIHHKNRTNSYCLADDIMEPYRPFVDAVVYQLVLEYGAFEELTKDIKADILSLLTVDVQMDYKTRPLMIAMSMTTASLARCFTKEQRKIEYPTIAQ